MKKLRIDFRNTAFVDDEDYERCSRFRWHIKRQMRHKNGRAVYHRYVYTTVIVQGKPRHLHLSRLVCDVPLPYRVTYISDNHLDCRKANLKVSGIRQDLPRPKGIPHWEILNLLGEPPNE